MGRPPTGRRRARSRPLPLPALLVLTLLAGLLAALSPARPAAAVAPVPTRAITFNMQGGGLKWSSPVQNLIGAADLVALQEAQTPPSGTALTAANRIHDNLGDLDTTPTGLPSLKYSLHELRWGKPRANPETGYLYYLKVYNLQDAGEPVDLNGNSGKSLAVWSAVRPDDAMIVRAADSPNASTHYLRSRPALGLKFGDTWFFGIHTESRRSGDAQNGHARDLVSAVADSVPAGEHWRVLGDFNSKPDTFTDTAGGHVYYARKSNGEPAPTQQSGYALDFMVADERLADHTVRLGSNGGSDHYPVLFADPGATICGIWNFVTVHFPSNLMLRDVLRTPVPPAPFSPAAGNSVAAEDGAACEGYDSRPSAVVSMGDSFISGEGGRWAGNANTSASGHVWGTDRAAVNCSAADDCEHDLTRVYGDSSYAEGGNRCDRSDTAPIMSAELGVSEEYRFNIACSGSETQHVVEEEFKGQKPQVEQLAEIAEDHRVSLVALSIGGNDLNFSDLIAACAKSYMIPGATPCKDTEEEAFAAALDTVEQEVTDTVWKIRETLRDAGQSDTSYRIVLQSYPNPLPRGADFEYPQDLIDYSRYRSGGCPFRDVDADWAHSSVVPRISAMIGRAAKASSAVFLDLQNAFAGHELCAKTARQATSSNSPDNRLPAADAEWIRWVPYLLDGTKDVPWESQGDQQEAIHPNAHGQRAMGTCLSKAANLLNDTDWTFRCSGSASRSPDDTAVSPVKTLVDASVWTGRYGDDNQGHVYEDHYLFKGGKHARFDPTVNQDGSSAAYNEAEGQLLGQGSLAEELGSLQGTPFENGVDTAFSSYCCGIRTAFQLILIRGDQYVRVQRPIGSEQNEVVKGPGPIGDFFHVLRGTPFEEGIDAAANDHVGGGVLMFRGDLVGVLNMTLEQNNDSWIKEPATIATAMPVLAGTGFDQHVDSAITLYGSLTVLVSGDQAVMLNVDRSDLSKSTVVKGPMSLTGMWPSLKELDWLQEQPSPPPLVVQPQALMAGPTPPEDPEPEGPGPWSTDAADQPRCRPDGMTPTEGVNTPYCLVYDDKGRERMGERHPRRLVGYFTSWRTGRNGEPMYLPGSIPWGQVTHINYAFAHIEDNRVSVGDTSDPANPATGMTWPGVPGAEMDPDLPYKGNFNLLNKYKKQHPRVKTLISVGGWAETGGHFDADGNRVADGGFYTLATNADGSVNQPAIDTFADSAVDFIRTYGFDGVDIDYEYPTALADAGNPADWPVANPRRKGLNAGYTALMKTLREKLDRASAEDDRYYQLTAAVSASGYLLRGQEDFRALQYLDFANTMTYDFHGTWNSYVGPQSPLYDDGKDAELTAAGIYDEETNPEYQKMGYFNTDWSYHYLRGALQSGRINLGIPYYTRGWKNVTGGENGLWGTSELTDQSQCPDGTGPNGSTTACGAGATGIDNLWHDTDRGREVAAGSNPMWHAKNLERGIPPSYREQFGLSSSDPANQVDGYTRHWDDTLKASWLWNGDKKVFLSTQDEQDIAAKADYIADTGAGGAMVWELAGDYNCPERWQCVPGYTLTKALDNALRDAGPYGNTRNGGTELPTEVVDVSAELTDYPTDTAQMWPQQPKLRITNNTDTPLPEGTELSFDIPTSTPPLLKDEAWQEMEDAVEPGHTGPNAGGLDGDFHRVTLRLGYCEDLAPGASRDIALKYYLPITGPANFKLKIGGQEYGLVQDHRKGTTTVEPDASGGGAACRAEEWDASRTYNPAWAPFTLWQTGDQWKIEDVNSGNLLDHPAGWDRAHLYTPLNNVHQLWNIEQDGDDGVFRITNDSSGEEQCLGAQKKLASLSVRDCGSAAGQRWRLLDADGNPADAPQHGTSYTLITHNDTTGSSSDFVAEPLNSGNTAGTHAVAGDPGGITRTVVSHGGYYWKAKYWTKGNTPDATDPNNPWTRLGPVPAG
ncbi:glycosyl hydrolase family 18 protein [Streptomyces chitinivorans]|uniref:Glycosyl hydrolase family 18 protein n=1 Tax=Streptomyces chitinivorans TaxID=1257027 RepID=A0ABW7HQJ9_9ACTN|nr:glycosyl hydrolase family 18 protein [Streptomyces chitinivorans]MDH2412262.1 glycosyl hydrolase family 18 protein [Streptomyces chitinivorans]